jgi:[ribosomal protein S5]-alanine N-acetyltransferase
MKIETERLILRDFVKEDWERVMEYQTDPLYLRYYEWTAADRTPESVQEFVGWFIEHQTQNPRIRFQLAVTLKSKDLLIGNCGVRMDKEDAVEADIGYELDPKFWYHGYATEAAHAIVDFGFSHFGVHRIWANCVADNTRFGACVGETGNETRRSLTREGILQRQMVGYSDVWHPC